MSLSEKAVIEFKEIYEKKYGKKLSYLEARKSAENLYGLFKLLIDGNRLDKQRQHRLKNEPKGFHVQGNYSCLLCKHEISDEETWYDKHGLKCMTCQKALDKQLIPVLVFKNNEDWYSVHDFNYYFGIKNQSIRKLVSGGLLKSRILLGPDKKPHFELFLIKDNPAVLVKKPRSYTIQNENGSFSINHEKVKLPEILEQLRTK